MSKVERWEDESDEDWAERLAEETAIANNYETTQYFVERNPMDETEIIVNYIRPDMWTWKEHPEGTFSAKTIMEWKANSLLWNFMTHAETQSFDTLEQIKQLLPEPDDEGNYFWSESCDAIHEIRKILLGGKQ